jgi:hypothetical protein
VKRVKLSVEEKLRYRRTIFVDVPDEMDEKEIERILDKAQKQEYLSDFMYVLDANGIENPDGYDDDLQSPWDSEVECDEYDIL